MRVIGSALGVIMLLAFSESAPGQGVIRTGQAVSYADYDDGWYAQRGLGIPRSYADHGNGTVTDLATGLVWMADPALCGPPLGDGLGNPVPLTWQEILDNQDAFECPCEDSYSWRVPDLAELLTLVDYSRTGIAIDTGIFACETELYWSSTTITGWSTQWGVGFSGWGPSYILTTGGGDLPHYIRPVLESSSFPHGGPYLDNGDGTVTDESTGLMWVRDPSDAGVGATYNWLDAIAACEGLDYAGYDDWRLPNINEVFSIMDFTSQPYLASAFESCEYCSYWSSTSSAAFSGSAFKVYLESGEPLWPDEYAWYNSIRPVRGPVANPGASGVEHWEQNP